MGTSSKINILNKDEEVILSISTTCDGYWDGTGIKVRNFLSNFKIVNGFGLYPKKEINGIGDLASQLLVYMKLDHLPDTKIERNIISTNLYCMTGRVYVDPPTLDIYADYNYNITIKENKVHIEIYYSDDLIWKGFLIDMPDEDPSNSEEL